MNDNNNNILAQIGGLHINSLNYILNKNNDTNRDNLNGEPELIQHSPYYYDDKITTWTTTESNTFTILSLNCASINAKFDEILIKLRQLKNKGTDINIICLQETWLNDDSDTSQLQIEDYVLVSQGKRCSGHGGLLIYVKQNLTYTILAIKNDSTIWENLFIEIEENENNKKIVIGNIYRPPLNTYENYSQFITELTPILSNFNNYKGEVIITGDFNIDLLKVTETRIISEYFDMITSHSFFPKITLPTRISDNKGTLIDNFLCKLSTNFHQTTAGIIVSRISDHFPYFLCINYTNKKHRTHKYIRIRQKTVNSLNNLKSEIVHLNIYNKLNLDINSDPNINYDIIDDAISAAINRHLPVKLVKFHKHKHKKSNWITKGIIRSIKYRDKLYAELKQTTTDTPEYTNLKTNLKTYNSILRRNINFAKQHYYHTRFEKCKLDIKNTWVTIK